MISRSLLMFTIIAATLLSIEAMLFAIPRAESYSQTNGKSGTNEAANSTFDSFEKLDVSLSFHDMSFNHLPAGFVTGEFLTDLSLESNEIATISPFSFEFVPRLSHLSLANNVLRNIDLDQFSMIKSLKTLNLNGNCKEILETQTDRSLVEVPSDQSQNYYEPFGFDQEQNPEYIISTRVIQTICKINLSAQLPNLTELFLENNNIKRLTFSENIKLPVLNHLSLSNNLLEIIDNDTLTNLHELAPSLSHLYLQNSNILEFDASQLPTVKSLYLDNNKILYICNEYCENFFLKLKNARNLEILSVRNNLISKIEADAFNYTTNLVTLDLSHNQILEIREGTFDKLHLLQYLHLDFNKLVKLNAIHTFKGLTNLEYLYIAQNNVLSITRDSFGNLVKLKTLMLNHNKISEIDAGTFSKLSSLEELSLAENQLSVIPEGCMPTSGSLITLNLNKNEFTSGEHISLANLPKLLTLSLKDNPLTSISWRWHSNAGENSTVILGNTCHPATTDGSLQI